MAIFPQYQPDKDLELSGNIKYRAIANGTDYNIDDVILKIRVIDPNTGEFTGDVLCINKTQDIAMTACPPIADLEAMDGSINVQVEEKFETNESTGEIIELLEVQLFDQNGQPEGSPYYTLASTGVIVVPTGTVADEPIRVIIGSEEVTATDSATTATLSNIPTNAVHAELHVFSTSQGVGGIVATLDGATTPDATGAGHRINDGGSFELQSASELNNLKFRSLTSAADAGVYVEYYNIQKSN